MFTPEWPSEFSSDVNDGQAVNGSQSASSDAKNSEFFPEGENHFSGMMNGDESSGNRDSEMTAAAADIDIVNVDGEIKTENDGRIGQTGSLESAENNGDDGMGDFPLPRSFDSSSPPESEMNVGQEAATSSRSSMQEGNDGIELTHDPITGITSVGEGDDVGGWTATFPDSMEEDAAAHSSNPSTAEGTTEGKTETLDEQDWQMKNYNDMDPSYNKEEEEAYNSTENNNTDNATTAFTGGDIWTTDAFAFDSPLKDLLDSQNFSLVDLLAQDELLQELRGCHPTLVEYFGRPEVVAGLVECLVCEIPLSREIWIKEEEERRQKLREEKEKRKQQQLQQQQIRKNSLASMATSMSSPTRCAPTVEVNSPDAENDGHGAVEAYWNSPPKERAPGDWIFNRHLESASGEEGEGNLQDQQGQQQEERSPEEEYDLRYVRYPYMACEVLCSEVGTTIDVLVDGHVDDITIDDEEDSLLGGGNAEGKSFKEELIKGEEDVYDDINVYLDEADGMVDQKDESQPAQDQDQVMEGKQQKAQPQPTPQKRILDLVFSVLIDTPPASLDDRRAGYFEKLLVVLFRKRSQSMSDYMNTPLIITNNSAGMAQQMAAKNEVANNFGISDLTSEFANGGSNAATNRVSSYVSLSQQVSAETNSEKQVTPTNAADKKSPPHTPTTQFADFFHFSPGDLPTRSLNEKILSPNSPPMLMCALFDHLHSHSMMHIVQRLLLPSPARQQQISKEEEDKAGSGTMDDDDNPNSAMNNEFMNTINQMNGIGNQMDDDEDMDDDDLENAMNHLFRCDWSEQPGHALELLLARLEGRTEPFLIKYGFPVGYDTSRWDNTSKKSGGENDASNDEDDVQDAALSCSQHASEILITIIQNSSLDSPVMISLSSDPALNRILNAASLFGDSASTEEKAAFVPYESTMTCAMTVMESLILQLGGYGAVATTNAANGGDVIAEASLSPVSSCEIDAPVHLTELGPHTPPVVTSPLRPPTPIVATSASLVEHLPKLLAELSSLLTHPVTKTWSTPAQYTHNKPRPILGTSRLRILRLIESLVLLGDPAVDEELLQSDCLEHCLNLFWEFEWCSMLHQSAANLLVHVFEGGDSRAGLQEYFIVRCRLLEKLMGAFEPLARESEEATNVRPSTDNEASTKLKELLGVGSLKEGESQETTEDDSSPKYGGAVLAMKDMYRSDQVTSSLESERGSFSDDENGCIVPVSDDDVDSAMEKECQDHEAMLGLTGEDNGTSPTAVSGEDDVESSSKPLAALNDSMDDSPSTSQDDGVSGAARTSVSFRRGYMGHVIIICQALVHACNNDSSGDAAGAEASESHTDGASTMGDFSSTSDFESSAVGSSSDDSLNSKKRKGRSPSRQGEDDVKRLASSPPDDSLFCPTSPISRTPSSPTDVDNSSSPPIDVGNGVGLEKPLQISSIIRQQPIHDKWQNFVSSVLSSEMTVQSTPLGGQQAAKDSSCSVGSDPHGQISGIIEDTSDNDFLGMTTDNGVFTGLGGGMIVGELDMDENDLDIAASMMEALRLPNGGTSGLESEDSPSHQPVGHSRRRGVIGGGTLIGVSDQNPFNLQDTTGSERGSGIANFGSVIQRPPVKEYVYDDPLGAIQPFGADDEEENNADRAKAPEDDVFMSDAMVVTNDNGEATDRGDSINRSESIDSTDDDDDGSPVIMDLFAGNFSFEDKDESSPSSSPTDDTAWANFANFDSAFEPTIGPPSDTNPTDTSHYPDDYFAPVREDDSSSANAEDPFSLPSNIDLVDPFSSNEVASDDKSNFSEEDGSSTQLDHQSGSIDNTSESNFNPFT